MKFVDLFAGIGGFRLGFEAMGCVCVWSSEIDPQARKVYAVNHEGGFEGIIAGDIREQEACDIPPHDLLLAGFPCQPFSIGGKRKGLDDPRGTLFHEILRILEHGQTEAFVLENVKGLLSIDGGDTFHNMLTALRDLGFHISFRVINSVGWLPQRRERVFITGHKSNRGFGLDFFCEPDPASGPKLGSILERDPPQSVTLSDKAWGHVRDGADDAGNTLTANYGAGTNVARRLLVKGDPFAETRISDAGMAAIEKHAKERRYKVHVLGPGDVGNTLTSCYHGSTGASAVLVAPDTDQVTLDDVTLSSATWEALQAHRARHEAAGNGFGYGLFGPGDVGRTLSARYHKDGSEVLVERPSRNPRRLTPRECARYMGFPDSFEIPVAKQHAYRLFGNAVCPPVAKAIAQHLLYADMLHNRYKAAR